MPISANRDVRWFSGPDGGFMSMYSFGQLELGTESFWIIGTSLYRQIQTMPRILNLEVTIFVF